MPEEGQRRPWLLYCCAAALVASTVVLTLIDLGRPRSLRLIAEVEDGQRAIHAVIDGDSYDLTCDDLLGFLQEHGIEQRLAEQIDIVYCTTLVDDVLSDLAAQGFFDQFGYSCEDLDEAGEQPI